jgi:mitogen-activated protein kinase kinase kinase
MAPEVVKQVAYTKKADIWSVGCLIVEMLTGEHPWAQLTQMQAIFKVPYIKSITESTVADFLGRSVLLVRNPRSRPTYLLTLNIAWTSASRLITKFGHLQETS